LTVVLNSVQRFCSGWQTWEDSKKGDKKNEMENLRGLQEDETGGKDRKKVSGDAMKNLS
jgi:hypothetical protein